MHQQMPKEYPSSSDWINAAISYTLDRWQRTILFGDIMRRRGNNYLDHLRAGQPPVLVFDYETVLDGMAFDPPVNYCLVKIVDRRHAKSDRRQPSRQTKGRRLLVTESRRRQRARNPRPIVVIDPRAGHGPGIGGSKLNSQIGVALDFGYPVYFVMFSPEPAPGQTIADVQQAEIKFLEEVNRRHTDAPKPAVIGNCQAGWAAALIGADRPDVTGPMVLNGSPLSYWGGVEGANPMRYRGGLCGGVWAASMSADLGCGQFDGAHLVAGFEDLNPGNTYWTKQYNLFAKVDTEADRYLNFEKWWGGFFRLSDREIGFITSSLFVGNELEKGLVELQKGRSINLKNFKDPIFVFASSGDNITPPPQALNWIAKVYGSVEEIKRQGQIIIYMVHENIGHLGIFVSGRVAGKEHRQIIGCLEMIDYLAPGLYEMVIKADASHPDIEDYTVQFEERNMDDILAMDDGLIGESSFEPVAAISRTNDQLYRTLIRPWLRPIITPWMAEWLRQIHPLRLQRYSWSDANPLTWPLIAWSPAVKQNRITAGPDNPFAALETFWAKSIEAGLNLYRDNRDNFQEWLFKSIYSNPWLTSGWNEKEEIQDQPLRPGQVEKMQRRERAYARRYAASGGFIQAVIRIIIAVTGVGHVLDKRQIEVAGSIFRRHERFRHLSSTRLKQLMRTQARVISAHTDLAVSGLASMLPTQKEREEAFDIALEIAIADFRVDLKERRMLKRIRTTLELHHNDLGA